MPLLELDGDTAWSNIYSPRGIARWPGRDSSRMVPVALPQFQPSFKIPSGAKIFTVGSCFARNIEQHLAQHGFDVPSHRIFGLSHVINKYHPFSILQEFRGAFYPQERIANDARLIQIDDDRWLDLHLHLISPLPREELLKYTDAGRVLFDEVKNCKFFIITLGLIEVWYDQEQQCYVNEPLNLAKMYSENEGLRKYFSKRFVFRQLNFAETYGATHDLFNLIKENCAPDVRAILTVSPVALAGSFTGKDVLLANTYSKSLLRTVAEEICAQFSFVDYLPSYESVTLSPRQEAWEEDGYHVTDKVVGINVGRMVQAYLDPAPASAAAD